MASMEKEYFWGCELSKDKKEYKWDSEDEELGKADIEQKLVVTQACLGAKAKPNERNLVQVTTTDSSDNSVTFTILSLASGRKDQSKLSLAFPASVVFKLIEGSGPIHLTGSVYQELFLGDDDEEESGEDEDEESEVVLSEAKESVKKRPLTTPKGPPTKIARVEAEGDEESDDDDDDDEEEDSSEESMEMEADAKQKKPAETPKTTKNKPEGKDAKPVKSTSEEDEEDSEEDSDDDDDDDDYDEEDESGEDDDDDDEDESDEEDEIAASLAAKKKMEGKANKKPPMTNGVAKADKKDKTEKQNKIPAQQPSTPKTDGKKDQGKKAGAKTPEVLSMDKIKEKLLKTPNLPKKVEKFKNYLKHSYKITDEAESTKLWDWLKENK
nr:nucleoplasmin-like protein ANO39 [Pocillopora verrucosa]